MARNIQIFIFAYLFFVVSAAAQIPSHINFSRVTKKEGLASNSIFQTVRDAKGFLWIATQNGLQRYDGNRFLTFRHTPGNPSSLADNNINHLYLDSKGRLWVMFTKQLGIFNTTTFAFTETKISSPVSIVKKMMEDPAGRLILFADSKQFLFDEANAAFTSKYPLPVLPGYTVGDMAIDRSTGLYWFTGKLGSVLYDPKTKKIDSAKPNGKGPLDSFISVRNARYPFISKDGSWWLVNWVPFSGAAPVLYRYDRKTNEFRSFEKFRPFKSTDTYYEIWNVFEQSNGTVWVYGMGLFAYYDTVQKNFKLVPSNPFQQNGVEYDFVSNLYEDREKNVWVCTNKGLYRFNVEAQVFHNIANRRPGDTAVIRNATSNIIHTRGNGIWVSTWGAGILSYNDQLQPVPNPFTMADPANKNLHAGSMYQRENGEIWIGTRTGEVKIFNPATATSSALIYSPLVGQTITQITEDKSGNTWLGTTSGLVMKCVNGNWKDTANAFKTVLTDAGDVMNMYADRRNYLWVCTASNGLYQLDIKTDRITRHFRADNDSNKGLLVDGATDIVQYNDSIYLIASHGLCILNAKTNTFKYLTAGEGLPAEQITNLILDKQNRLWVALDGGLYRLNIDNNLFVSYGAADGIASDIFQVASGTLLRDGRIAIGTPRDILVFDPEQTVDRYDVPPISISGFSLGTKSLPVDSLQRLDKVRLSHDNTFVTIQISTLSFRRSYYMYYMLEGLDKTWKRVYNNEIIYQYLPAGGYTLKLKSQNAEGVESKQITALRIQVSPPFWKAWWFFTLLILAAAMLLFWFDHERIKRKTAILRMRSDIADGLHQDINAALSNITILSEMARLKADREPEKSKEFIEQIHAKSRNMTMAMDDILWSIDPDHDSMENFLLRFREYIDALQTQYNVQIEINADDKTKNVPLNMGIRNDVFWLFKKVITSSLDAGAQSCRVLIGYDRPNLLYSLKFDPTSVDTPLLQKLPRKSEVIERLEELHGRLELREHRTESEFILTIPIRKQPV